MGRRAARWPSTRSPARGSPAKSPILARTARSPPRWSLARNSTPRHAIRGDLTDTLGPAAVALHAHDPLQLREWPIGRVPALLARRRRELVDLAAEEKRDAFLRVAIGRRGLLRRVAHAHEIALLLADRHEGRIGHRRIADIARVAHDLRDELDDRGLVVGRERIGIGRRRVRARARG